MTVLRATTMVAAPIEICFQLSLNIDLALLAGRDFGIKVVDGVKTGLIGAGQRVTWHTKQFGFRVVHVTEITAFEAPVFFQDRMIKGIFSYFQHDHFFRSLDTTTTEMRDEMRFSLPLTLAGPIAERLFVMRRLAALLRKRNSTIRSHAEHCRL